MRKKVYFLEFVFTDKYYIDGIDVLNENNLLFVKNLDLDLKMDLSFSKIDNAKLYKIIDLNILIAIADVRDFKVLCYLKANSFFKIINHPRHQESVKLNHSILEEYVIDKVKKHTEENILYSADFKTRAVICLDNDIISIKYQTLNIGDDEDFYFYEDINSNNFWFWEDMDGISYYDTLENARKASREFLSNYVTAPNIFFDKPYNSLWSYQLDRFSSWLYQMKFACLGIFSLPLLLTLFPLLGLSSWNIMWLFGGCAFISLIIAGSTLWNNYGIISYEISDKGIHAVKGLLYECSFDNIKKIKIKKNLFNKNKGSVIFKLYKGLSINYNFINIEKPEEAYKIIKDKLESIKEVK